MALRDWLQEDIEPEEAAPGQAGQDSIYRSYRLMRTGVGILGMAMPLLLLFGDWFFVKGTPTARGSLSAYYYSGMRDVFVGILFAVAPLLITYKIFERSRGNVLSIGAGLAALGVALFPTGRPSGSTASLTPLQDRLGEGGVEFIHYLCAVAFIGCLAFIAQGFARQNGGMGWLHRAANAAIVSAVTLIIIAEILDVFGDYALLVGESIICVAFSVSWLRKGLDLRMPWPRQTATPSGDPQADPDPLTAST